LDPGLVRAARRSSDSSLAVERWVDVHEDVVIFEEEFAHG